MDDACDARLGRERDLLRIGDDAVRDVASVERDAREMIDGDLQRVGLHELQRLQDRDDPEVRALVPEQHVGDRQRERLARIDLTVDARHAVGVA